MKTDLFFFKQGRIHFSPSRKVLSYAISYESQLSVMKVFFLLRYKMGGLQSIYKKKEE